MTSSSLPPEVFVDVSDLPPPEPLEAALFQLQQLPKGHYLRIFHRMEPCLLFAHLEENDFDYKVFTEKTNQVHILIWHRSDPLGKASANAWLEEV